MIGRPDELLQYGSALRHVRNINIDAGDPSIGSTVSEPNRASVDSSDFEKDHEAQNRGREIPQPAVGPRDSCGSSPQPAVVSSSQRVAGNAFY